MVATTTTPAAAPDGDGDEAQLPPLARARAILRDVLRAADAWGDKDREAWEQRRLGALRDCIISDTAIAALARLPKRMCAYEFKPGDIAWNCKVCQVDETCVMCNDCFISSDHEQHEVFFYYTHSGGCCDCGDTEAWNPEGFCTEHRGAHDADPLALYPPELVETSRAVLAEVLGIVLRTITEARESSILTSAEIERVRTRLLGTTSPPPELGAAPAPAAAAAVAVTVEPRYSVIVHYNELQSSQEFAAALARALPSISYQTLKIVGEASTQRQSLIRSKATREEALEVAEALNRHGLVSSIVSSEYKSKLPIVNSLLQWLVQLANLSDGVCRLICEQFISHSLGPLSTTAPSVAAPVRIGDEGPAGTQIYPILRAVILADSFLPKHSSDALHSLLMSLLADPVFKKSFAVAFTSCYRQLYREYIAGVGSSSVTILTFSVQFFNRASFVKLLVADHELLEVLGVSVLETLRRKQRRVPLVIPFSGSWGEIVSLLPAQSKGTINLWDAFALGIQRSNSFTLWGIDIESLEAEAREAGLTVQRPRVPSPFLVLPSTTELPGRFDLDVSSPVFVYRRYMAGLLDLRYALQIEGISERFVLEKNGARLADFLLYLSYLQGMCSEVRRFGDHVEMESRGWVVTVEFVSTASDVFTWIISNVFKSSLSSNCSKGAPPGSQEQLQALVTKLTRTILDSYYFWLASAGKYFPPVGYEVGLILEPHPVDVAVSCHFPLHRTFSQLLRALCDSPRGLSIFYDLVHQRGSSGNSGGNEDAGGSAWLHEPTSPIGFWHRVHLIEPVLQAIVWDAEVHSGLWVRNGMSVINHSMNYGEPPFCLRFRDLDLLLLQFGFQLLGIDWMIASIVSRFGVAQWFDIANTEIRESDLMVTECITLLCQLASELPPRVGEGDGLRSLTPYLRREIVQRLIVGPCAHSDLSKIATEFFVAHENVVPANFSSAAILDQVLKDICVTNQTSNPVGSGHGDSGGKVQYRLKPELYAEYNPTFIHLTRKQHEAAHENWFQHRLRGSKSKEQQQDGGVNADSTHTSWLDFPFVNSFLPCATGFRISRISILHEHVQKMVYEALWRASSDSHSSLNVLSRAVHLFTLQIYVVEDVRYALSTNPQLSDGDHDFATEASQLCDKFIEWVVGEQPSLFSVAEPRPSALHLLLKLNPWLPQGGGNMVSLDGDQKHEIGRGIDWLMHRLARLSPLCHDLVNQHMLTRRASQEEEDRKAQLAMRRKEAQMRAILQMQQRQAAFAEQMKAMMGSAGGADEEEDEIGGNEDNSESTSHQERRINSSLSDNNGEKGPASSTINGDIHMDDVNEAQAECAMCHSVESEGSFMCYVGFAQCSPVLSRLNGGFHGPYLCTPMDEMHHGEDVPVHVRLCGHSVHHTCWESYHASQFQRAITGGHHRHALNAVDVTKKEFLCPLCKSISNILIPTTNQDMTKFLSTSTFSDGVTSDLSQSAMLSWLEAVGESSRREHQSSVESMIDDLELKPDAQPVSHTDGNGITPEVVIPESLRTWLEEGLSSLCMAVHKVACGATQKSRPDRYTASGCLALFHTLLCTFLGSPERDQLKPEQRFLQAMRYLPLMLRQVTRPKPNQTLNRSRTSVFSSPRRRISHLVYFGGSEVLPSGSVVLEEEPPSTQTQTRKQSQWGKMRWPTKPLLLSQLGRVLVKGVLLAESQAEATFIVRLVVLGRLVQSLLWFSINRDSEFSDNMSHDLSKSDANVATFVKIFFDGSNQTEQTAVKFLELLRCEMVEQLLSIFPQVSSPVVDPAMMLNFVATEVVPMMKVATYLLKSLYAPSATDHPLTPVFVTSDDLERVGFLRLDDFWSGETTALRPVVVRWVQRFKAAYEEMHDPQLILQQWLTNANMDKTPTTRLDFPVVLSRDLHTMFTSMSVFTSGAHRTRYLRGLPRAYVKFYAALAKRKCQSCHQFPARPAVCLVCGMLLCAANTCPSIHVEKGYPEESNPGACTVHAKKCGRGSGMFLLVLEGAVLLVYWKLAAYVGSLYVDEYGEEFGERNRELNKGRPLYLNDERRDRLLRLWLRHEIPNEVVRIQNSSDRVIRNSHY